MRRLVREPLVHFLLLGAALFAIHDALNSSDSTSPDEIIVTSGQIESMITTFAKVWQRPPSESELKELIDDYVKQEVLSREAIKLGLDQNDTIIRRRLQQKMEFIAEDFVAGGEPTEAELEDYFAKHPEQFALDQHFTFRQILLSPEKHGDQLETNARALLAELRSRDSNMDVRSLGDSQILPQEFSDEPQFAVAAQFGTEFVAELERLKTGEWNGPIPSGFGSHLVFLENRTEGRVPPLAEVREDVARELVYKRRAEANAKVLEGFLANYRVTIEAEIPAPIATSSAKNQ